jgi:hypothetical protein
MGLSIAGCGDDSGEGPMCAEINLQCTNGIQPTWDDVYNFVIKESCAAAACHGEGMQGGLKMSTSMEAYQALVEGVGGKPRVIKGDAACSMLTERIESDDLAKRMPFMGMKLSAGDRCAIEKWIAAGAPR